MPQNPHVLLTFDKVQNPLHLPRKMTSKRPKVLQTRLFFTLLTSKCASRHNGVRFFDISTSKSGPDLVCFVHFDMEMCFAPQQRALFRHLSFQKWSDVGVFCTFWLPNVLRATTACNVSSLIWPDGSAPAALASILFDPGATNHWKNTAFGDFPTFSRAWIFFLLNFSSLIFFLLLFSSLTLPISALHLSILSEVWLLNFLRSLILQEQNHHEPGIPWQWILVDNPSALNTKTCWCRNQPPHIWKPAAHSAMAMACKLAKMPNELTCDGSACAKESRIFLSDFLGICPRCDKNGSPWATSIFMFCKNHRGQPGTSLIHFCTTHVYSPACTDFCCSNDLSCSMGQPLHQPIW